MTETTLGFECVGCTKTERGEVDRYILKVINFSDGRAEQFSVEAKHLASARSMKRILLGRKLLYFTTQRKHEEMLEGLFEFQPAVLDKY